MQRMLLFFICCLLNYANLFPTNVVDSLIWKSKSINFVVLSKDDDERVMFLKLIYDTVLELNKVVGGHFIQWSEISEENAISKERYIIFVLEKYKCGETVADSNGGFYLPLSISPECNNATNLRNLMVGLGFIYTHLRTDRDEFITINLDNLYNIDHQIYDKRYDCMESENEAFAVYDYNSILHWPQYSIYAKNSSVPIITPKQSNIQMNKSWKHKSFSDQDIKIFKAIYG